MCRNIRSLYNFDPPATDEEVRSAALQYVRKISGFSKPSKANEQAFEEAVDAVAEASARLLGQLVTSAPPNDREVEAAEGARPGGTALRGLAFLFGFTYRNGARCGERRCRRLLPPRRGMTIFRLRRKCTPTK